MSVYFLGELNVDDWDWYKEYRNTSEPIVKKYGGKYLIKGGKSSELEGEWPLPSAFVLIEFPDEESALGFFHDDDYRPMIELRRSSGVQTKSVIIEGFQDKSAEK